MKATATSTTKEFLMLRTIELQAQQIAELQRRLKIVEEHLMPKSNGQAIQYFTIEDFEGFVMQQLSLSALVIIEKTQFSHIKTMRLVKLCLIFLRKIEIIIQT